MFPTYEALTFSHEPHRLAAKLAEAVTVRLEKAHDPKVEGAIIADELRLLGYALTTSGYFADRQIYEVRQPPDSPRPGVRITMSFSTRRADALLLFMEEDESGPLAARLGTLKRSDARHLRELVLAPEVDLPRLATLLEGYRIALRGLQLDLRLGGQGLRGWLGLHGADLELTTRPVSLFAEADVGQPGEPARLYTALIQFAQQTGLPDPPLVFDALEGGTLDERIERVGRALGGRLQRLHCGEPDRADTRVLGLLASGLFSIHAGPSVEVLLLSDSDPDAALHTLERLAERHRVRLHEGADIRLPGPPHHGAPSAD